jgi:hypothetical protein
VGKSIHSQPFRDKQMHLGCVVVAMRLTTFSVTIPSTTHSSNDPI